MGLKSKKEQIKNKLQLISLIFLRVVEKDWMALKSNGQVSDSACFASGWYDSLLEKVLLLFSIIMIRLVFDQGLDSNISLIQEISFYSRY